MAYHVALVRFELGDKDAGFALLERAFDATSYRLAVYLNTDARRAPVSADARYGSLRARMHLPAAR